MKFILTSFLFFSSLLGAETRLAILGSGTPNPDPQRMGSSYAVIINDNAYESGGLLKNNDTSTVTTDDNDESEDENDHRDLFH